MKRLFLLIIAAVMLLCGCAKQTNGKNNEPENNTVSSYKDTEQFLNDTEYTAPNEILVPEKDYNALLETVYAEENAPDYAEQALSVYSNTDEIPSDLIEEIPSNRSAFVAMNFPFYDFTNNDNRNLNYAAQTLGTEIKWSRNTGISVPNTEKYRMYSVFKAQFGGYIYVFFDAKEDGSDSKLKSIIYLEKVYREKDFSNITEGTNISALAQFDTVAALCMNNYDDEIYESYPRTIYYVDNHIVLVIYGANGNIFKVIVYEGYTLPNPNEIIENDAVRSYDFTILPQDYPPAN